MCVRATLISLNPILLNLNCYNLVFSYYSKTRNHVSICHVSLSYKYIKNVWLRGRLPYLRFGLRFRVCWMRSDLTHREWIRYYMLSFVLSRDWYENLRRTIFFRSERSCLSERRLRATLSTRGSLLYKDLTLFYNTLPND